MSDILSALLLGIVEGLTEFLPVSSTGHLIIVGDLLNFNDERGKLFEVVIQLGAILAVCWEYRQRLVSTLGQLGSDPKAQRFTLNLLVAFLPAAILGFLFIKQIKLYLFNPISVAMALVVGGLFILWTERRPLPSRIASVDEMSALDAFKVGCAQTLALVPGVSRAGATIIGGLWFGLSRQTATEFSFFLAIPVMFAATCYDLYKHGSALQFSDWPLFATGFLCAFVSAFIAVRGLLRYVAHHDFTLFAWYRIGFGLLILLTAQMGWVDWSSS